MTSYVADADDIDLLRGKWKVYRCSPLHRFKKNKLGSYARQAEKFILKGYNKKNTKFNVCLVSCPELRCDETGPPSLRLEVAMNETKLIYTGYFINWSGIEEPNEDVENLPLLLVDASQPNSTLVHEALMPMFDCTIVPMELNATHLMQLFAVFVKFAEPREERSVDLKYQIPGLPASDSVEVSVRICDVAVVINFMIRENQIAPSEIPFEFYLRVLYHIQCKYKLDLRHLELSAVSAPDGLANSAGQISMKNPSIVGPVLVALQSFLPTSFVAPPLSSVGNLSE